MKPHPTLSKGEGFKALLKVSPFGGDLEGASCFVVPPRNDMIFYNRVSYTSGSCWLRQWKLPKPHIISVESIPITS